MTKFVRIQRCIYNVCRGRLTSPDWTQPSPLTFRASCRRLWPQSPPQNQWRQPKPKLLLQKAALNQSPKVVAILYPNNPVDLGCVGWNISLVVICRWPKNPCGEKSCQGSGWIWFGWWQRGTRSWLPGVTFTQKTEADWKAAPKAQREKQSRSCGGNCGGKKLVARNRVPLFF